MFKKPDLILLHAPAIYDFRKRPNLLGPISDVVPSTPIFEMYPVGFSSLAEHLERHGIGVRIVNLAYRMLSDPKFDAEKMIASMRPVAFGIDLHWLVHAQGSLEVAAICKKYHPQIPVIFGGYSSTYFHDQLIRYPQVDFVVKGDSTEEPMLQLMMALKQGLDFTAIPNLTWKNQQGEIFSHPITYLPEDLNSFTNNYKKLFKLAVKYFDTKSMTAIHDWWRYPITAVMTCRGCIHNCIICGGSKYGMKYYCNRLRPSFRDAERIVEDIREISRFTNGPIFIIGDLNQPGYDYADKVISGLKKLDIENQLVFELFEPAPENFFEKLGSAVANFNIEFSPESHDYGIRRKCGKRYTNEAIELNIQWALQRGCKKFDLFFMIGLPHQTAESVLETVSYCGELLEKFGPRVVPFIAPLAPFLDPGSIAFENPEKFGYKIFYHTLEDYRQALLKPSWKYFLSYETCWLSRDDIVSISYEAGKRLLEIKYRHGLISEKEYHEIIARIDRAIDLIHKIDELCPDPNQADCWEKIRSLELRMERDSIATINKKAEIQWPILNGKFKPLNIIKAILFE
ncbi:MAG: TIGR04190 family B12-binding domain/radical SAM domain protein [candidate division KSB1 bacterium]|nr:TIGR04190 family B12-binding domain/radical SAM domain protein [candidate division KSB1 bacterium]MDZ7356199.1 TIGR04190 family B12-binding domain/radical SAM domain protein [candidate division KSB1 bacterium]MDZ7375705.1 TIGR04190 family B12-binding domain/radical SAM domain protein [candidate division KSB1 bacterium]